MSHAPTAEQAAIIAAFGRGEDLVVNAYAGSGKTTILRMLAESSPRKRFLYVAYNKAAKLDAAASFPANARCCTSHGLAFQPMITMARRIGKGAKYLRGMELAKMMGIREPARLTASRVLAPGQLASIVKATIGKFCYSADDTITSRHVPADPARFADPEEIGALRRIVPPLARRAWEQDITRPGGVLPMQHDYYLKAYALTHPRLPGDVIALDEAQDSNPCVEAMIRDQIRYGTQVIMVGDTYQAIYGWRGATDAMARFAEEPGVTVLSLTQSFRFGDAVAAEGSKWLTILGAPLPLRGFSQIQSRIGTAPAHPDAVLCRTNAEALKRAIGAIGKGLRVAFPKGTGELTALTRAAADLKAGRPCEHPDLIAFTSWAQVQDFAENEADGEDLKRFVDLVDEHGTDGLLEILTQIGSEDRKGPRPDVTISTAHAAKGREWRLVEIAGDFPEPKRDPEAPAGELPQIPRELAMLAYVAVTRAQYVLDRAGLAWVDAYLPGGTREDGAAPEAAEPAAAGSGDDGAEQACEPQAPADLPAGTRGCPRGTVRKLCRDVLTGQAPIDKFVSIRETNTSNLGATMTATATRIPQHELDARAYDAFVRNGESKAAAGRELGISASTVSDRIKRHLARAEQDQAAEPEVSDQAAGNEVSDAGAEMPAGITEDDYLAYRVKCDQQGCGAEKYQACASGNREGTKVLMPYAHPVRISAAKAAIAAGELTVPQPEEAEGARDVAAASPGSPDQAAGAAEDGTDAAGTGNADAQVTTVHDGLHTHCVKCGWDFGKPIKQSTCGSKRMCDKRAELKNPAYGRRAARA